MHGGKFPGLGKGCPVQFAIMAVGSVEGDDALEELALATRLHQLIHQPMVAQSQRNFRLFEIFQQFARTHHWHGIDDHSPRLGCRQPAGDHGRIVARADENAIAWLEAVILDQRPRQLIGPFRQFAVSALSANADQRHAVAEPFLHHTVRELHSRVEIFGVVKALQIDFRPLFKGRKMVAREGIRVSGWTQIHVSSPIRKHLVCTPCWFSRWRILIFGKTGTGPKARQEKSFKLIMIFPER